MMQQRKKGYCVKARTPGLENERIKFWQEPKMPEKLTEFITLCRQFISVVKKQKKKIIFFHFRAAHSIFFLFF